MSDNFGCAIAGPAAAIAGVVEYQRCVLAYRRFEAWGAILTTADAHPGSAMAQCLAADFLQQRPAALAQATSDSPRSRSTGWTGR